MVQLSDRTLPGADDEYRRARVSLLRAETDLREATERVAAMRRALPPGPEVRPYVLREEPADPDERPNATDPDGVDPDGVDPDGVDPDGVDPVSCAGSGFAEDFGASDGADDQMPAVSVFTRDRPADRSAHSPADGPRSRPVVRHRWTSQAELLDGGRGIDGLSSVWNVLDLTPLGRPDWWPGNDYPLDRVTGRPREVAE